MIIPRTGLNSARVAWRHSLRFRLSLIYSMLSLTLILLISLSVVTLLLSQMENQFKDRLNERADTLAESFTTSGKGLGKTANGPSSYTILIDSDGIVLIASPILKEFIDHPFPYEKASRMSIGGTPVRAVTRKAGEFGTLWVALPEDDLVAARQSAFTALLFAFILTPLILLFIGRVVVRRTLDGLVDAANLADQINPTQTLAALPLPEREDEVHRLLTAINRLLVRIEDGQAREKQLLGQIVHELGAPLTVLKASLNRAVERTQDPEIVRAALVADELTFTTQDLMQMARGELEIKLAWHYIAATTLQARLDRLVPNTTFTGDWSGGILCDPDRLTQALRNLLANGRRAAGNTGTVTAELDQTDQWVSFVVRDTGAGLPPELGEKIFEPFISGAGSSGLGLSVSRQIAVMHGGKLIGQNHSQGGAQFTLNIPSASLSEDDDDIDIDGLALSENVEVLNEPLLKA